MSRIAKQPILLPQGVDLTLNGTTLSLTGDKGALSIELNTICVAPRSSSKFSTAISGTTRALIANMVNGVINGYEKKLELVGVGYRAKMQGKKLNLTLGFSHPVAYSSPEDITIETPSQTEIVVNIKERVFVTLMNIL